MSYADVLVSETEVEQRDTKMVLLNDLADIGSIMNVEELLTLPSAVSWTDKPFTYYLHTIDRSLVSTHAVI